MTGVEGYIESTSSGFVSGISAAYRALGKETPAFTRETVIGSLAHYVAGNISVSGKFQPMNANFGIVAPLEKKVKGPKKFRNEALGARAIAKAEEFIRENPMDSEV